MKRTIFLIFLSIILIGLVYGFGLSDSTLPKIPNPSPPVNYSLINTNSSDFWDSLDTPLDISAVGTLTGLNVNGKVGIGTTSPDTKLHIYGATNNTPVIQTISGDYNETNGAYGFNRAGAGIILKNSDSTNGNYEGIFFVNANNYLGAGIHGVNVIHGEGSGNMDTALAFYTRGIDVSSGGYAERMRINEDGNVGIGTTNPLVKFEVYDSHTKAIPTDQDIHDDGSIFIHNPNDSAVFSGLSFETRTTYRARALVGLEWTAAHNGDLFFRLKDDGSTSKEVMRMTSGGKVGIGTTGPSYPLHIFKATGSSAIEIEAEADNAFLYLNSNTDNAGGEESGIFFQDNSVSKWELYKDTSNHFRLYDFARTGHVFRVNSNGNMFLMEDGGNVGIGTTSPNYKLTVGNGSNTNYEIVSIYSEGNISSAGYLTRTSVFPPDKRAWDYIRNSSDYLSSGIINHSAFGFGYVKYNTTDFSRPAFKNLTTSKCNKEIIKENITKDKYSCEFYTDEEEAEICDNECWFNEKAEIICIEVNCRMETRNITKSECIKTGEIYMAEEEKEIEVCTNETQTIITYPYNRTEEAVSLGSRVAMLEQAMFELYNKLEDRGIVLDLKT